jgi:two-component system nitrogen regulation response regulator NtrX
VTLETVRLALPDPTQTHATIGDSSGRLADRVQGFEREVILSELKRNNYQITKAAKSLGLERSHLYKKAEQLGIDLPALRREPDTETV